MTDWLLFGDGHNISANICILFNMKTHLSAEQLLKSLPKHGGDIDAAARIFNIEHGQWIDLSTGINPMAYPVTELPVSCYTELPYLKQELVAAAEQYYGYRPSAVVAGTQVVIQQLPSLLNRHSDERYGGKLPVLLPAAGYSEHRQSWQSAGNSIRSYSSLTDHWQVEPAVARLNANQLLEQQAAIITEINDALAENNQQHLVLIQPNNPTGLLFSTDQVIQWANQLADDSFMVVDEAFIDSIAEQSLLSNASVEGLPQNVIVLRSFGKFFGLAGLRLGFVFVDRDSPLVETLNQQQQMAEWAINGPAQEIACRAFNDLPWQQQAVLSIKQQAKQRNTIFAPFIEGLTCIANTDLFVTVQLPLTTALAIYNHFAMAGILLRVYQQGDDLAWLRIGNMALNRADDIKRVKHCLSRWLSEQ